MDHEETTSSPPPAGEMRPDADARERMLDELLVIRVQEGSRVAFEQLVTRWQDRLWRHAYRLTGREHAAWDVMQDSWMRVTRGLTRLRDPSSFRRWAYTIVTRAATDRLRQGEREEATPPATINLQAPDDAERIEREEAVAMLRVALRELPREQRVLLSLRYLESFRLWELAEILDVPEGTVKSRLHHARNRLKEILERKLR